MVFTNTYAISAIITNVVSSIPAKDEVYSLQYHVVKFVSDLRQISGFLLVTYTNKTDRHDMMSLI